MNVRVEPVTREWAMAVAEGEALFSERFGIAVEPGCSGSQRPFRHLSKVHFVRRPVRGDGISSLRTTVPSSATPDGRARLLLAPRSSAMPLPLAVGDAAWQPRLCVSCWTAAARRGYAPSSRTRWPRSLPRRQSSGIAASSMSQRSLTPKTAWCGAGKSDFSAEPQPGFAWHLVLLPGRGGSGMASQVTADLEPRDRMNPSDSGCYRNGRISGT